MPKANRTCYCCGHEYYYCPSCPGDKRDPQIYTIWDSEICKDIFNTLVSESTKKVTTKECKEKLIELGINKIKIDRESVKNHINRVMSYEDANINTIEESKIDEKEINEIKETIVENKIPEMEEQNDVIETESTLKVSTKKKRSYLEKIKDN